MYSDPWSKCMAEHWKKHLFNVQPCVSTMDLNTQLLYGQYICAIFKGVSKSNYAEAVISTLRDQVYKFIHANQTNWYIDHLKDIIQAYNEAFHSGIEHSPASIGKRNEVQVWVDQCMPKTPRKTPLKFKLKKGKMLFYIHRAFTLTNQAICMNHFTKRVYLSSHKNST